MKNSEKMDFEILVGKTLTAITKNSTEDELLFTCDNGDQYKLFHQQDCCENVSIDDIVGDLDDLIGTPIIKAEQPSSGGTAKGEYDESFTWTFYHLATIKGYVTIKWYGTSNGYYSESVDFVKEGTQDEYGYYPYN